MSAVTVGTVVNPAAVLTALTPLAVGAGAVVAAGGVAVAAVAVARKLHSDYASALDEFNARADAQALEGARWAAERHEARLEASELAAVATAGMQVDATALYLRNATDQAARRAEAGGFEDLRDRAVALHEQVQQGNVSAVLSGYLALAAELDKRLIEAAKRADVADVLALVRQAREEVQSTAIQGPKAEELRAELLSQLDRLEAIAERERGTTLQGLERVQSRLRRETADRLETARREAEHRQQRRRVAGEAVAMLRAVSAVPDGPEPAEAVRLLEELGTAFSAERAPSVSELEGFLAKARALFEGCKRRLEAAASAALVADNVSEVLMELGYRVSHVEAAGGKAGCLVSVEGETGMVVSVDEEGRMQTEMVAFDESAVQTDEETQERVCAVVDQVLEGLKRRGVELKEKSRRRFKRGERLRVVERPAVERALAGTAAPKVRTVE